LSKTTAKKKTKKDKSQKVVAIIILDRTTGKKKIIKGKEIEQTESGFMVEIKDRKQSKEWKPTKRFLYKSQIDPKTGETIEFYITAKSPEEEKECEKEYNQRILETIEIFLENKHNKGQK